MGLTQEALAKVMDGSRDLKDRWRIVEPSWEASRYTGYGRALDLAVNAIGGDYLFPDGVYGHLLLARQNVSRALAAKVEQGVFPMEKAVEIARALFYDNPLRIFQLEGC